MTSGFRTRLILIAVIITGFLIFLVPASFVFAEILQSPGERWQATYQQKDLPANVSETGRGFHYVQDHPQGDFYDIFPMRASIFQISEARFLILNNDLNVGEEFSIDLVSLDEDGNIIRVLSQQVITSDTVYPETWQTVDLPIIKFLSTQDYLAFHVTSNITGANPKIAYEVSVHNMITGFYSFLPLIFR